MTQSKGLPFEQAVLTNAFRDLPNYVFCKDTQLVYRLCNDPFVEYAGFQDRHDIIGKTDHEMPWGKTTGDLYIREDLEVLKTGEPMPPKEVKMSFPGKQDQILLVSKKALKDDKNQIVGILGIYIDITERKHQEEATQEALRLAEAAVEAKSAFIANMSHDLRTPITGMLGMIHDMMNVADETRKLVVSNKDINSAMELLRTVERDTKFLEEATNELLQFCNDTLEIARLEQDQATEKSIAFDVKKLVSNNIRLLTPIAHHKNIALLYEFDDSLPAYLSGLHDNLNKILLNLISNALKFTKKGSVTIKVYATNETTNLFKVGKRCELNIEVTDTGIGIAERDFKIIFDRFSRLTPSYEGVYKGAGLGLYTVKKYVSAMNGEIIVESELGKGSCFTVKLPLTVSAYAEPEVPQKQSQAIASKSVDLNLTDRITDKNNDGVFHILVVEDNMPAAIAVQGMLKKINCRTDLAKDGKSAVEMANSHNYDLVLMDVGLPDFSGIEATKQIRAFSDKARANIPVIALTGHGNNPETRQEALDAGMQDVLTKPAQLSDLETVIAKHIVSNTAYQVKVDADQASESNFIFDRNVIDWEACVSQCGGDVSLTKEMLNTLANDLKTTKTTLEKNYVDYNEERLRVELHRVRGGISYLTLPELSEALKAFHETVKKPGNSEQLKKTHQAVMQAIDHFWDAWKKYEDS